MFVTTNDEVLRLVSIATEMLSAGVGRDLVARAVRHGVQFQGLFDLMVLWSNARWDAEERADTLIELERTLQDVEKVLIPAPEVVSWDL